MEKQKNYFDLIIVGAGASGLMAAIQAHDELMKNGRNDIRILVVDKNDKAGKKLLATGNGRCNLTNRKQMTEYSYAITSLHLCECLMRKSMRTIPIIKI